MTRHSRSRTRDSNQFLLPFDARSVNTIAAPAEDRYRLGQQSKALMPNTQKLDTQVGYKIGVSITYEGTPPVNFEFEDRYSVLEVLSPHIGESSALLLELLGYHTIRDLARTGYHLSSIPSIGPKKTEKILTVVEGFGFSPPRRPAPVPKYWRTLFAHAGQ
jgi:hypothetical protein